MKSTISEKEFQAQVIEYARLKGWLVNHTRPARTATGWRTPVQGDTGFPDLVLARKNRVIFAELKVGNRGLRLEQARWLAELEQATEVYLWYPEDWTEIERVLE